MSTPWPRPMVVTSSRNGKTSPLPSMRRNGVSTADPPFYRSRDYRLTTGLPPCHGPFRAALTLSGASPDQLERNETPDPVRSSAVKSRFSLHPAGYGRPQHGRQEIHVR